MRRPLKELLAEVLAICKEYDSQIQASITDDIQGYEHALRFEEEESGINFPGPPNLGYIHLYVSFPKGYHQEKREAVVRRLNNLEYVARIFEQLR